ncbi:MULTISPECIES: hypothetical protein [unclassified Chelatococcus]|uniref:hypothetical protein n=1 Tax=unclassified Chelatococcus TaxID=2638111 RepID=UPI001BCB45B7|nr:MULTISPECIES: hypothetical protein [unclassified Chelatococcus]CAH1665762.1 hypothetical protein CHELA41_22718 [Hyphomicrobiales bacterium]MBS7737768.1 hypothetical protein [Chelatococcus sp. HY11]MBS7737927.1 hypothetical protein [Chelatococcus sp. HY11]MCO5077104.1 hypothetical protein [Chelatococcus sp.]CAH1681124.1 hypothetical protein CHELA20_52202 [Hyphomicrobiales bacterium]
MAHIEISNIPPLTADQLSATSVRYYAVCKHCHIINERGIAIEPYDDLLPSQEQLQAANIPQALNIVCEQCNQQDFEFEVVGTSQ